TTTKRWDRTSVVISKQYPAHGTIYQTTTGTEQLRQHVWHCSNWGQLQKDAQTQCVTSLSRGKPSGAAEPGPFGGGCIQKQGWGTRCRAHGVYARCLTRTNHTHQRGSLTIQRS